VEGTVPEEMTTIMAGLTVQWDRLKGRGRCEMKNVASDMPLLFALLEQYNLRLVDFEHIKPTLDDLFLTMTGRRLTEETP
jgi:hypothetical protein